MGFYINEEGRQHINLSEKAMKIIESDMIRFNDDYELKNKSGFVNTIISNYYDSFPLSRKVFLKQIEAIERAVKGDEFSSKLTAKVIDAFSEEITKLLIKEYADKYSNNESFKLKLNKENIQLLATIEDANFFEQYAPRSGIGYYLKIILESYARLNKEERQKIYFKEIYNDLLKAFNENKLIAIQKEKSLEKYEISNFFKPSDKEFYELEYIVPISEKSFHVQGIKLKDFKDINYRILNEKQKKSYDYINKVTNPKVSSRPILDYVVEFTGYGLDRFLYEEDKLPIIGIPDKDNKHRYTFTTTETQIFLHLFKFGPQIKIIKPKDTRDIFKQLYKKAYEVYENDIK